MLASEGGAGTCFVFAWSLPARWTAAAQPGPQTPSPMAWPEGPGTQACRTPPQRSRAATRLACTVFPGLLPLSWTSPHPGSRPLLSPRPSLPSEDPASGVVARSGVGEAAPDRMAMTWDVETVTSASSSPACPLMLSCNTYHLTWVSLTLDVGYLFTTAPAKRSHCSLSWTRGISSPQPFLTFNVG